MRFLQIYVCFVAVLASCTAKVGASPAESSDSSADVPAVASNDTITDSPDVYGDAIAISGDTLADGCHHWHHRNQNEQPVGNCWAPPLYVCEGGASEAVTHSCMPDLSLCCTFSDTCKACGWVSCPADTTNLTADQQACLPLSPAFDDPKNNPLGCAAFKPDFDNYCLDGL